MAIHTLAKRSIESGKKDYTVDAQRNGIDIYEMLDDPIKGFITKTIGFLPSEKVTGFSWSGSGDVFAVVETESSKNSLNFYMISIEQQQLGAATPSAPTAQKGKNAPASQVNKLTSQEEKYQFKKTGRQDIFETKFDMQWDPTGRYLAIFGIKRSPLDKADKSIKFYNIFGEAMGALTGLQNLNQYKWRPRPTGLLTKRELTKLQGEFRTKYQKMFKEEEKAEKK